MHSLNEQKVLEFAKAYVFADGLIRRTTITYGRGVEKSSAVIDVSVRTADDEMLQRIRPFSARWQR